jgi:type I restriction enzyme, S subunit
VIDLKSFVFTEVPKKWRTVPFWSLFKRLKLTSHETEELLSVYRDHGVVPTASRDDNFNKPSEDLSTYQLVEQGWLVTNKMKAWQGSIAISRFRGIVSPAYYVYRPLRLENDQFLHYLLRSEPYVALYGRISKGVRINQWDLEHEALRNIPVILPGHDTQKVIVAFLDRETARIEQLIEKKSKFSALAEERWCATLDNEIKGQMIGSKRAVAKNNSFISELPERWALTPLKYLVDVRRPVMYGIVLPGPDVDDGVLIVKGGDVKPGRLSPNSLCRTTREIEAGYARSRLRRGDLVIAIRGGIGDVEIVPPEIEGANLTQDAARIAPRRGVFNHWLRYALQAPSVFAPLAAGANGAAVRGINIFDLDRVLIPTPTEAEQINIAERLSIKEREIWRMRQKIAEHAELIRELRSALIAAAVTGQIDVVSWSKRGETDRRLDAIQESCA